MLPCGQRGEANALFRDAKVRQCHETPDRLKAPCLSTIQSEGISSDHVALALPLKEGRLPRTAIIDWFGAILSLRKATAQKLAGNYCPVVTL